MIDMEGRDRMARLLEILAFIEEVESVENLDQLDPILLSVVQNRKKEIYDEIFRSDPDQVLEALLDSGTLLSEILLD